MYYTFVSASCPNCKKAWFTKITKVLGFIRVTSGLGPNNVICRSCKINTKTTFKEWWQMSSAEKAWYWVLSLIYGAILGFPTSLAVGVVLERVSSYSLTLNAALLLIIAPISILVFLVQGIRIQNSIERTKSMTGSEVIIHFWNWETNLQFYGYIWVFFVMMCMAPFLFM